MFRLIEPSSGQIQNIVLVHFTVSPCILMHQVLFSPTHALFHTNMYQSFKLY